MPHRLRLLILASALTFACGDADAPPEQDASMADGGSEPDLGAATDAAATLDAGPGRDAWIPPPLEGWSPCTETPGVECAVLRVPLEPFDDVGTLDVHVTRAPARDPARRIGVLFLNPGGPGGASGPMVEQFARDTHRPELAERFDLVGVDSRGVGQSAGIQCLETELLDRFFALETVEALDELLPELLAGCLESEDPALLARMSTAYAVRDLEWVRAALGEEKISFLGASYGGKLAASYASLHPSRVRAFVLDSPMTPGTDYARLSEERVAAQEATLEKFFEYCGRAGSFADFHRGEGTRAVAVAFDALLERARDGIVLSDTDRRVYQADLRAATLLGLASGLWYNLSTALRDVERGGPSTAIPIFAFADALRSRSSDGSYAPSHEQNWGVTCGDFFGPGLTDLAQFRTTLEELAAGSPRLGISGAVYQGCADWPEASLAPITIGARNAPPMLIIGGENDPFTPMSWALELRQRLNAGSFLFRSEHLGHVGHTNNPVAYNRMRDFLLDPSREPNAYSCLRNPMPVPQIAARYVVEVEPFFYPALTASSSVTLEIVRRTDDVVLASTTAVALPGARESWRLTIPTEGAPLDVYVRGRAPGYRVAADYPAAPLVWRQDPGDHYASLTLMTEADLARRYTNINLDPATGHVINLFRDCDSRRAAGSLAPSPPPGATVQHGRDSGSGCFAVDGAPSTEAACGYAVVTNVPPGTYRAQYTGAGGVVITGPEYRVLPGSYTSVTIRP